MSDLAGILAYRNVYALSTIGGNGKLKCTHYACCLSYGSEPIWGVWTVKGQFLRFYGRKSQIKEDYSSLVWRVRAASWTLKRITDEDPAHRSAAMVQHYTSDKS